jgi:hypothetical protein
MRGGGSKDGERATQIGDLWSGYLAKKRAGHAGPALRHAARSLACELSLIEPPANSAQESVTEPAIVLAAAEGLKDRVELLLDAGEPVDATHPDHDHFTALHQVRARTSCM